MRSTREREGSSRSKWPEDHFGQHLSEAEKIINQSINMKQNIYIYICGETFEEDQVCI